MCWQNSHTRMGNSAWSYEHSVRNFNACCEGSILQRCRATCTRVRKYFRTRTVRVLFNTRFFFSGFDSRQFGRSPLSKLFPFKDRYASPTSMRVRLVCVHVINALYSMCTSGNRSFIQLYTCVCRYLCTRVPVEIYKSEYLEGAARYLCTQTGELQW